MTRFLLTSRSFQKPLADVDFDDMNDNGTPDPTDDHKNIVFSGVTFVEPVADPVVYDAITGAEFIGTYTAAIDLPADFPWYAGRCIQALQ